MRLLNKLKYNVMEISRHKKLDHFYRLCSEHAPILDVGVSQEKAKVKGREPPLNTFLKTFRYGSSNYTGLGVEDLSGMGKLYPGKRFVQYSGGIFPFKEREFEWVFSNAVIEHVGDDDAQVEFLNEMMRVGRYVFFTTPWKYFPIESHTNVLFLHWNNRLFYSWCRKNKPFWTKRNLYLFSARRLDSILKRSNAKSYKVYKNRMLGITMTFTVVCSQRQDDGGRIDDLHSP